jgi:hypothetical protein
MIRLTSLILLASYIQKTREFIPNLYIHFSQAYHQMHEQTCKTVFHFFYGLLIQLFNSNWFLNNID